MDLKEFNPERARDSYARAYHFYNTDRLKESLDELRNILDGYDPQNVDAHLLAARIYLRVRQPHSAEIVLTNLHKFTPPSVDSLTLSAKVALQREHYEECQSFLDEVFGRKRDHRDAVMVQGDLFLRQNRNSEAIKVFESLHEREREVSDKDLIYSLAYAHYKAKDYEDTIYYCSLLKDQGSAHPLIEDLYRSALDAKRIIEMKKNPNLSLFQRIFWRIYEPYAEKSLRIQSVSERRERKARQQTMTDNLTRALNRAAHDAVIPGLLTKAENNLFYVLCDIDFFKAFNDCFVSHQVGDVVLKALAAEGGKRFPERFFRMGGEEFCWVMLGTLDDVLKAAKEFRAYIEEHLHVDANSIIRKEGIKNPQNNEPHIIHFPITISQGIALFGDGGSSIDYIKEKSDACLYQAKEAGRNAVVYHLKVIDRGKPPMKYTPFVLDYLHKQAVEKGSKDWWEYKKKLDEKAVKGLLETAHNAEKMAASESKGK